jgi:hypothetical protein
MIDEQTFAEYTQLEGHTGLHLPFLVPEGEQPPPADLSAPQTASPAPAPEPDPAAQLPPAEPQLAPPPPHPLAVEAERHDVKPETALPPETAMLDKHTIANRRNALLGGVKTEEGKSISRLNARKHGIFATCLSPMDHKELEPLFAQFAEDLKPVGAVEGALVEKIAVTYLRMQRCARAESACYDATWRPITSPCFKGQRALSPFHFETAATLIDRYNASLTNQFLKLLHELERIQRRRAGDPVKPPSVAQVDINTG